MKYKALYEENINKTQSFRNNQLEYVHTITQYWPASSQIANLFIEISAYYHK